MKSVTKSNTVSNKSNKLNSEKKTSSKTIADFKMPIKKDGSPDERYTTPQFVKKDGTRDMRTLNTNKR